MTKFDRVVASFIAILLAVIVLTVLAGDRVGVKLVRVFPLDTAHSTDTILVQFSELMNRDSVSEQFNIEPDVEGDFGWSGDTFIFRPSEPLKPGNTYVVTLNAGSESRSGREVLDSYQFSFRVRQPQVAYLGNADGSVQNIWLADPANPDEAQQITFSQSGIFDFSVSPDGRQIAFSERRTDQPTSDLKILNLDDSTVKPITTCDDSDCTSPVWRPDGNMIAYTRVDFNSLLPDVGISPSRVWLVDLTTSPPMSQPLFQDSQVLGYGPQWSKDGQRITLFDNSIPGILVYDFKTDDVSVIQSEHGTSGALSPDGTSLVYPELVFDNGQARSRLLLANIDTQEIIPLTEPSAPVDDDFAAWSPTGDRLVIGRRYWDDRYTRGLQLYLMDPVEGEVDPLVVNERYANGFVHWDPTGTSIVMQRFPQLTETGEVNTSGRPEIWTYNLEIQELTLIAENGFFPRWVP